MEADAAVAFVVGADAAVAFVVGADVAGTFNVVDADDEGTCNNPDLTSLSYILPK